MGLFNISINTINVKDITMVDQTLPTIAHIQTENKAKRHEQLKKEQQIVFNSSNLDAETKNKMIEFVKSNSTHKLRKVVKDFFSNKT
tara:strand:+ start:145 stop:405 length:261 start_codon:yes stop_codon:yes gene_type:complete